MSKTDEHLKSCIKLNQSIFEQIKTDLKIELRDTSNKI